MKIQVRLFFTGCLFLLQATVLGQNVKLEIGDFARELDGKNYSTFQFVNSSYSRSRATIVFITSKPILLELTQSIPKLFKVKQEYTDVWVLGIADFDPQKIGVTDQKIITTFFQKIIKYRNDNDLPAYSMERLEEARYIINSKEEICKYIACRSRQPN